MTAACEEIPARHMSGDYMEAQLRRMQMLRAVESLDGHAAAAALDAKLKEWLA